MQQLTVNEAISQALKEEMQQDARVLLFGEGVATKRPDLVEAFGSERVRNTPLSEAIIAGTAAGAAATGLRPIIDLLYAPFLTYAMDAIVNSAGKLRYLSGGQFEFPMVVLAQTGGGWGVGAQHNHNLEAWFAHVPGLKVVMPSAAEDFKGLLKSAIRDNNPVLFFIDLALGEVISPVFEHEPIPLGKAKICREGKDVSLISYAKTVNICLQAAEQLALSGIQAEVIDLRSLKPLDENGLIQSVKKTGRAVVVHEAGGMCSMASEVSALLADKCFGALRAPIIRVTGPDVPAPSSFPLEQAFIPQPDRIQDEVKKLLNWW